MTDSDSIRHLIGQLLLPGTRVLDLSDQSGDTWLVGPGLRLVEPWEAAYMESIETRPTQNILQATRFIIVTHPGVLHFRAPHTLWIGSAVRQYVPRVGDCVLGNVIKKSADLFVVDIGGNQPATLPCLAFEGATKRNRPDVHIGDIVYAKLEVADKDTEPELICMDSQGKSSGFGVIGRDGGIMIPCTLSLTHRLLDSKNCSLIQRLGQIVSFEIVVGSNGRIWVSASSTKHTVVIINCLSAAEHLDSAQCKLMIKSLSNYT